MKMHKAENEDPQQSGSLCINNPTPSSLLWGARKGYNIDISDFANFWAKKKKKKIGAKLWKVSLYLYCRVQFQNQKNEPFWKVAHYL